MRARINLYLFHSYEICNEREWDQVKHVRLGPLIGFDLFDANKRKLLR